MITALQFLIFTAYVLFIYKRYGVLSSISASSYRLQGKSRWLFFGWLASLGILNFFQGLGGWGFGAGAFLAFAGITIDHADSGAHQNIVHAVGTVGAIILAYTGLILQGVWIPAFLFAIAAFLLRKQDNAIWWIEVAAFLGVIVSYLWL